MAYMRAGTDPLRAQEIYRSMKLPVIGGLTQAEGEALGAFSTNSDLGVHGIMLENGATGGAQHAQHAQHDPPLGPDDTHRVRRGWHMFPCSWPPLQAWTLPMCPRPSRTA